MIKTGSFYNPASTDNLIAGANPAIVTGAVTLTGLGVLKRGTVLALSGSTYSVIASATTGKANCIVADDIDTTGGATVVVYKAGMFNRKALVTEGYTITPADEEALRNGGIFLSDMAE